MKQRFNEKEYAGLKHRAKQLRSWAESDSGPEQETAERLLAKVEKKLKAYEQTHEIPTEPKIKTEYTKSSSFNFWEYARKYAEEASKESDWEPNTNFKWHVHFEGEEDKYTEDTRSESQMVDDLGVIYMIFGSTYQTALNYHVYKIRFKNQTKKEYAFFRVYCDVYEDDIRICEDVIIGFWPLRFGDDRCGDMQFAAMDHDAIKKYDAGCMMLYNKLTSELKDIWNSYFEPLMLTMNVAGYIGNSASNPIKVQLNAEQRKQVIETVEEAIDSGTMTYSKKMTISIIIEVCEVYASLEKFLDEAGVVYLVESDGVYIWNYKEEKYRRLVDYRYNSRSQEYILYLI